MVQIDLSASKESNRVRVINEKKALKNCKRKVWQSFMKQNKNYNKREVEISIFEEERQLYCT